MLDEMLILDIVLDDFLIDFVCVIRFLSLPFPGCACAAVGSCRFVLKRRGVRGMERVFNKSVFDFSFFGKSVFCISLFNCIGFSDVGLSVVGFSNIGLPAVGFSNIGFSNSGGCGCS